MTQHAVILLSPNGCLLHKPGQSWLKWIWSYLQQQESWLLQILFTGFLYASIGLLTSLFVQTLIDKLIPAKNQKNMIYMAIALTTILGIRALLGYVRERFLIVANKRLSLTVTDDFINHLFRLPKRFFDSRKIGDITARISDSLKIHRTVLFILQSVVLDLLLVVGSLLFMFYFSVLLGWLTLSILPFYVWLLWRKSHHIKNQQQHVMKAHAALESTYINSIQGVSEIMSCNAAPAFTQLNRTVFGLFQEHIERLGFLQAGLTVAVSLLGSFISVGLLTLGALQVMSGALLLGQFMAAYSLLAYILPSVAGLITGYVEFQGAQVAAQRMMDLFLIDQEKNSGVKRVHELVTVKLCHLAFAYPKSQQILSDVSLTVPAGRITALWGPSGAGKTTLVQLLQRKYKPTSGEIRWNEERVEELDLYHLREMMGVVPQHITVFNATLAENILVGRAAADIKEINSRLHQYRLTGLIDRFEHGLFTLLGEEGRKLSGAKRNCSVWRARSMEIRNCWSLMKDSAPSMRIWSRFWQRSCAIMAGFMACY